jgi:hypothetical protein
MSATTPDGLVSFKGYLASGGGAKNTGQPPYTIKAADLDENFRRLVVRSVDGKISVKRTSDGQRVDVDQPISVTRRITGQEMAVDTQLLDVVVDGVIRQMVVVGSLVPEA